jgi:hypothetical protein
MRCLIMVVFCDTLNKLSHFISLALSLLDVYGYDISGLLLHLH